MATIDECLTALRGILQPLAAHRAAAGLDRTLSCRVTDLEKVVLGRLADGSVQDLHVVPEGPEVPRADIRLAMSSDDLVALTAGNLSFGPAWASGRISFEAGLRDVLRLRSLL